MHDQALHFMSWAKSVLGDYFINKRVLDVGSGDINGNNRHLFDGCLYEGNDVTVSKNATIVSKTKDLQINDNTFHTIVSTECFEHDPTYEQSLKKIYKMLKPGGLFCFTCASTYRPEHGTARTTPGNSFGTIGDVDDMVNYYKNLTEKDIHKVLNLPLSFSVWNTYYNASSCDLYFIGIKNTLTTTQPVQIPLYRAHCVANTTGYLEKEYEIIDLYPHINKGDWVFHEGVDSGGGDITWKYGKDTCVMRTHIDNLFVVADGEPGCVAFNTLGFLKSSVNSPFISNFWTRAPNGLYIRKSHRY